MTPLVLNPRAGCRQERREAAAAAPGFAPAPAVTVARGGPSRSVESARGVAVQRLRRNKGFTAETITFLIKTAAMLWLNLGRSSPYSSTTRLALPALAQWGGDAAARSLRQKERWRRSHVAAPPEGAETEDAGLLPRSPFFPRALRLPPRTQNDTRHLAPTIRVLLRACKMGTKKKNLE